MLIIDSNFNLHRTLSIPEFHDLQFLGQSTAFYGYLQSLHNIVRGVPKNYKIVSVWDGKKSERRKQYYAEYKNKEPLTEQDKLIREQYFQLFNDQKKILETIQEHLGIINIKEQYEADDIIYKLCDIYSKFNDIIVLSEDKDLLQLINFFPNVRVARPIKKDLVDINNFKEKTGVHPNLFLMYKAMIGDTSDKITNIEGVGKKTAQKIIEQIDPNDQYNSIIKVTKPYYDEDMKKPEETRKFKRESLVYKGIGVIARNLELMDLSREYISNQAVHDIKTKVDSHSNKLNEQELIKLFNNYGFNSILNQWNFWIDPFRR